MSRPRRAMLAGAGAAAIVPWIARAQTLPGVTATELRIGTTTSLSGPVSALGTINKAQTFVKHALKENPKAKIALLYQNDDLGRDFVAGTKDPSDPVWADDAGMKACKAFMEKYYPEGNPNESCNSCGYMTAIVLQRMLEQCKGDFSRKSIMAQANNLRKLESPMLRPGITVNTSPTNHHPFVRCNCSSGTARPGNGSATSSRARTSEGGGGAGAGPPRLR